MVLPPWALFKTQNFRRRLISHVLFRANDTGTNLLWFRTEFDKISDIWMNLKLSLKWSWTSLSELIPGALLSEIKHVRIFGFLIRVASLSTWFNTSSYLQELVYHERTAITQTNRDAREICFYAFASFATIVLAATIDQLLTADSRCW